MRVFFRRVSSRVLGSGPAGPDTRGARPEDAPLRRSIVLGLGAFATCSFASLTLTLVGCGESSSSPPLTQDEAKKTAKYRELHPEEFRPTKTKTAKGRRG